MKYIIPFLTCFSLLFCFSNSQAQDQGHFKEQLSQDWVLKKGWFGDKEMIFERKDLEVHNMGLFKVFAFDQKNKIHYELFNPQKFGMCGNGLLFINKASWEQTEAKMLRINLDGGRYLEDRFQYIADYVIAEVNEKSLKLKLIQEIKNERTNYN